MCSGVLNLPVTNFNKHKTDQFSSSEDSTKSSYKVTPFLVDFRQLLKQTKKNAKEIVSGISNLELLHGAATLYGVSLSDITDDVIYPILNGKWSKTILMLLDETQAGEKTEKSLMTFSSRALDKSVPSVYNHANSLHQKRIELKNSAIDSCFVNIFSDNESNSNDGSDDEVDYTAGIDDFLQKVDERRKSRQRWIEKRKKNLSNLGSANHETPPLGIENRLVACATFEKSYDRPSEKVFFLSLLAVRKKFRNIGIGSFLLKQIINPKVTGDHDVIVVNAEKDSVGFFEKYGFTDDVILNSRYAHIGEVWFNSKRMCYLKEYSSKQSLSHLSGGSRIDFNETDMEVMQGKERDAKSYQSHASIVQQLRNEILSLHAHLSSQDQTISKLQLSLNSFDKSQSLTGGNMASILNNFQHFTDMNEQHIYEMNNQTSPHTSVVNHYYYDLTDDALSQGTTSKKQSTIVNKSPGVPETLANAQLNTEEKHQPSTDLVHPTKPHINNQPSNAHAHRPSITKTYIESQPSMSHMHTPPDTHTHSGSHRTDSQMHRPPDTHTRSGSHRTDSQVHRPPGTHSGSHRTDSLMHRPSDTHTHSGSHRTDSQMHRPPDTHTHSGSHRTDSQMHRPPDTHTHSGSHRTDSQMHRPPDTDTHSGSHRTDSQMHRPPDTHTHSGSHRTDSQMHRPPDTHTHSGSHRTGSQMHRPPDTITNVDNQLSYQQMRKQSTAKTLVDGQQSNAQINKQFTNKALVDNQSSNAKINRTTTINALKDSPLKDVQMHNAQLHKSSVTKTPVHNNSNNAPVHTKPSVNIQPSTTQTPNANLRKSHVEDKSAASNKLDEHNTYLPLVTPESVNQEQSGSSSSSSINKTALNKDISQYVTLSRYVYPDLDEDNFLNFVGQSTEEFCNFAQNYKKKFEDFAQKSSEEFQHFVQHSSNEFQSFFLYELKHCFLTSISEQPGNLIFDKTKVVNIKLANLPQEVTSRFNEAVLHSHDANMIANLYFCGGEHHQSNCNSFNRIINTGFLPEDFVESGFGNGLYFSRHANTATYFSPSRHVLVAKVCLGHNKTLTKKDPKRVQAPDGFDSILTPGRLLDSRYNISNHRAFECSEYVIFNPNLVLPLAIIEYKVTY